MRTGKTGKIPTMGGGTATAPKKKNNALLWFVVFLMIIGCGVGLFFALREKPPREVSIREMEQRMVTLLQEHFIRLNVPFDEARHEHRRWFYRPVEGQGPEAAPRYSISDPIPVSENQDRFLYDENAIIIRGLPCNTLRDMKDISLFDNEHLNLGKELVPFHCKYENFIYFMNRPYIQNPCINCGNLYKLSLAPARPEINAEKWNPDERVKEELDNDKKYVTDIASKHGIAPAELQKRISHALVYKAVWPENVQEIPEEERVPEYYTGKVQFLKMRYFWDQAPRIHRVKADDVNTPVRFEKIWPSVNDENGRMVTEGTIHFRRGQIWLHEAEFEFRNGNLIWVSEGKPIEWVGASREIGELHEFTEAQEILDAKAAQEKVDAEKRKKAKKPASSESTPEPEKKTEEPKPEEKK